MQVTVDLDVGLICLWVLNRVCMKTQSDLIILSQLTWFAFSYGG